MGYVQLLSAQQVLEFWPLLEQRMVARPEGLGGRKPAEIFAEVVDGTICVWALASNADVIETVILSEVYQEDRGTVMKFAGVIGENFEAYLGPLAEALQLACQKWQVDFVEAEGRPGWAKMLKPLGFKLKRVVMEWRPHTVH